MNGQSVNAAKRERITTHILLALLVIVWGFDYVAAKDALETLEPLPLLNLKYLVGIIVTITIKIVADAKQDKRAETSEDLAGMEIVKRRRFPGIPLRKKDIPLFIVCALMGELFYFYCEYSAMDYMPISLITILLSFVPALSIIIERVVYKKKSTKIMNIGVIVCIFGVALVIGVDYKILFEGRLIGYLFCFGAVASWNFYNFLTASLTENYKAIDLTVTQLFCTILLTLPFLIAQFPEPGTITPLIVAEIVYLGVFSAGLGFIVMVRGLEILGPTPSALYSNFLPVSSAILGWIFLDEMISAVQMLGGVIVIASGCIVIREKGKLEEN